MHKFSICMPCFGKPTGLKRAIDSILDQKDYDNWELIVVFDGENKEGEEIIKTYTDPRIQYLTIEHKGACAARNAGQKVATGDYYSFFSSDFVALPGMLRIWEKALVENPEYGFVYGGYELLDASTGNPVGQFLGDKFDYRQLQTANYIDGGFPVRKEVYVPWDEAVYSLNDWDFWLNICDKGVKGFYMGNVTYQADMPKPGGLSDDSSKNWLERVGQIKLKHSIPDRDVVVCSIGAPFHAKRVADMIDADFSYNPSFKPHKYKMVYLLGCYATSIDKALPMAFGRCDGDQVKAVHWIGNDVYLLGGMDLLTLKRFRYGISDKIEYNLAEYPYTRECLKQAGIRSGIGGNIPILGMPMERPEKQIPLPEKFTVAVYNPNTPLANDKYAINFMTELASALPDIQFLFYGGLEFECRNIKAIPWTPIEKIIEQSSILLRFTQFDGLPNSAIEFLMQGRQVITNTPMPYVEYFKTLEMASMNGTNKYNHPNVKDRMINRIRRLQKGYGSLTYPWQKIQDFYMSVCGVDYVKKQVRNMVERKPLDEVKFVETYYKAGSEYSDLYTNLLP